MEKSVAPPEPVTIEGVPSFLETPPISQPPPPPVHTLHQTLPFDQLTWENFERLCVRIARLESQIERSQLYGEQGQRQQGIDLYARSSDGTYRVYQSKRVKDFNETDLREAVDKFLRGNWASRVNRLLLCIAEGGVRTQLADEYVTQYVRLKERGITFDLYDREELSTILKSHPELVHDFFGKSWVTLFNGEDAASALAQRLEPAAIGNLREKLRTFYSAVFDQGDVVIPLPAAVPGSDQIPVDKRFVFPDIIIRTSLSSGTGLTESSSIERSQKPRPTFFRKEVIRRGSFEARQALDVWITRPMNSLITGGPGTGKSALLRYLALDILSNAPKHPLISAAWAQKLPIWIPFAFWTKQIADNNQCSIKDCLQRWLSSWSQTDLWPLVEQALKDERLLLLVDGLDEWTTQDAGTTAVHMLQVFIKTHKAIVVATSRPYSGITIHGAQWQVSELAPLSANQQQALVRLWYLLRNSVELSHNRPALSDDAVEEQTRSFLHQLAESQDLDELAGVPLLLILLIFLRFQNAELPRDRFSAYKEVIDYLIKRHPATKKAAALLPNKTTYPLKEQEIRRVLGRIAYELQTNLPGGVIDEDNLLRTIEQFLGGPHGLGFAMNTSEIRVYAEQFTRAIEGASGLLVRQGTGSLSFLHRSLQEFLAATHISRHGIDEQRQICKSRLSDLQWREVILAVLWMLERPDEITKLVNDLREAIDNSFEGHLTRELLAEAVFGNVQSPGPLAREIANSILDCIGENEWTAHRRQLLHFALGGLHSAKIRDLVTDRLTRWVFVGGGWRPSWYEPLIKWPKSEDLNRILMTALRDEDVSVQQAVASVIATRLKADKSMQDSLAGLACKALNVNARANALMALARGSPDHPDLNWLIDQARNSKSGELEFASVSAQVSLQNAGDAELSSLISLSKGRIGSKLSWRWNAPLVTAFLDGFGGNQRLKAVCLKSVGHPYGQGEGRIDEELAQRVLLQGFPNDPDVVEYCIREIKRKNHSAFLHLRLDAWKLLATHFAGNQQLAGPVDKWISEQQHRDVEVSLAALVSMTETAKHAVIECLNTSSAFFWPAESLLRGWGMKDPEVASALRSAAYGNPKLASAMGRSIPEILTEPDEARRRLFELLQAPETTWKHRVLEGLISLAQPADQEEIVTAALKIRDEVHPADKDQFDAALIVGFPSFGKVKSLAKSRLKGHYPLIAATAAAYHGDSEMRDLVSKHLTPLPPVLRIEIIQALGKTVGDSFTLDLLGDYDMEEDDEAKTLASIAFHRRLLRERKDYSTQLDILSDAIEAGGPDYEERQRAAFAALLILGRLDLMDKPNRFATDKVLSISLGHFPQSNVPLVRLVAENWEQLCATFGSTVEQRLSGHFSDLPLITIAGVAADYPAVQPAIWQRVDPNEISANPALLKLFAATYPKSESLRTYCVQAIRKDDNTWGSYERLTTAADIIADHFAEDETILKDIVGNSRADQLQTGQILAITAAWPDYKDLPSIYDALIEKGHGFISYVDAFNILYAGMPSEDVVPSLLEDLNELASSESHLSSVLLRPVLRRLRRDETARDVISKALLTTQNVHAKATFSRILSDTGVVPESILAWIDTELNTQLNGPTSPAIGFDLVHGGFRSVALALLQSLRNQLRQR